MNFNVNQNTPAQQLARVSHPGIQNPKTPTQGTEKNNSLQKGDNVSISAIQANVLNLEAQITQFKMMEEQQLAGVLNEQLNTVETTANQRRDILNGALKIASQQRAILPEVIENQSVNHSFLRQIEGQESAIMDLQNQLEAYVADLRRRSNMVLSQVNGKAIAGTDQMDKRIGAMRQMIGEISTSPLTRDLVSQRLR